MLQHRKNCSHIPQFFLCKVIIVTFVFFTISYNPWNFGFFFLFFFVHKGQLKRYLFLAVLRFVVNPRGSIESVPCTFL